MPEMKNLAALKKIIDDYRKGKVPSIKLVMLTDFSNELGIILNKFNQNDSTENILENIEANEKE